MSNPNILWAQDRTNLFLTLEILNLESQECTVVENKVIFKGKSLEKEYNFEIELYSNVDKEKYTVQVKPTHVYIMLEKTSRQFWNRLTKTKQNNVKIDWQKWVHDEESSEDSDENEELMQNFNDFKKTLPSDLLEKDFTELLPGHEVDDNEEDGVELDLDLENENDVKLEQDSKDDSEGSNVGVNLENDNENLERKKVYEESTEDLEVKNSDNSVESLDSGFLANGEESITEERENLELRDTDGLIDVSELDVNKLDAELENDLGI